MKSLTIAGIIAWEMQLTCDADEAVCGLWQRQLQQREGFKRTVLVTTVIAAHCGLVLALWPSQRIEACAGNDGNANMWANVPGTATQSSVPASNVTPTTHPQPLHQGDPLSPDSASRHTHNDSDASNC